MKKSKAQIEINSLLHLDLFKVYVPSETHYGMLFVTKTYFPEESLNLSHLKSIANKYTGQDNIEHLRFIGGRHNSIFSISSYPLEAKRIYSVYYLEDTSHRSQFYEEDLLLFLHFLRINSNE